MITFGCDKCTFQIKLPGTFVRPNAEVKTIIRVYLSEKDTEVLQKALPGNPTGNKMLCAPCLEQYLKIVTETEIEKKARIDKWFTT